MSDDRFTQTRFLHEGFAVGAFRCPRDAGEVGAEGRARRAWLAFPRTTVRIEHADRRPVLSDATCVVLYNPRQAYRREMLESEGDRCDLFAVPTAVAAEIAREARRDAAADPDDIFTTSAAPCPPAVYLRQRALFRYVSSRQDPDPLLVAEQLLLLYRAVAHAAADAPDRHAPARSRTATAHRDLVEQTRSLLNGQYHQAVSLHDIARRVHASPFHLARVFKRETGLTLHEYVTQLRLRAALAHLPDHRIALTELALAVGFSSHSHFSAAFRQRFGLAPRDARAALTLRDFRQMSKIMTAGGPTKHVR